MILTMVATQLYTVVDTMIIGLCLDANALAAVSNASTALLVFLFVSGGMELGGGLLLAAKRPTATPRELSAVIYNLLFIDVVLGLIMTTGAFLGIEGLLRLIHTPAEIIPQAVTYSRFYLVGLPFLMVYDLSKQLIMGCGDSKTPLFAVLGTSVLNILLDLALVGPFGVAGAAAATSFSQVVGFVFILWYLHRTLLTEPFRFSMLDRRYALETFRALCSQCPAAGQRPCGQHDQAGADSEIAVCHRRLLLRQQDIHPAADAGGWICPGPGLFYRAKHRRRPAGSGPGRRQAGPRHDADLRPDYVSGMYPAGPAPDAAVYR